MEAIWVSPTANTFALRAEAVTFVVEPGTNGQPIVTVSDRGSPDRTYSSEEVTVEEARIGTWYTVASPAESFQAESLSVLVPIVTVWPGGDAETVSTVGVRTVGAPGEPAAAPRDEDTSRGQKLTYHAIELQGEASLQRN